MARYLLRAGFPLTVYNRTQRRALPLREAGATVAESPVEVAPAARRELSAQQSLALSIQEESR